MKEFVKKYLTAFISYLLKGLLIVLPFFITVRLVTYVIETLDTYFNVGVPAVGFLIALSGLAFLGYVGSNIIAQPIINLMDEILSRIPFIKIIYTSVKEFTEAFVGEKRKFKEAVLVELADGIFKPGFITQKDLTSIGLPGKVAVYFPHSYAFSGNLFLVDSVKIKPYAGNPAEIMKFIVSGGVTDIEK
jgi:uncharacterized membrane protein